MKIKFVIPSEIKNKKTMKTRIIKRLASLCVLSVWLGTCFVRLASGQQSCCLSLPAPPANAISVNLTAFQSPDHFFDVQVVSAPSAISPGQYNGWCVEERLDINVSGTTTPVPYSGQVFSSCDPNINTYLANESAAVNGDWQAVNYILKTGRAIRTRTCRRRYGILSVVGSPQTQLPTLLARQVYLILSSPTKTT